MRYVIYGSGAVGGAIGGRLFSAGASVIFIARGHHFQALHRAGLHLVTPDTAVTLPIPVVNTAAEASITADDVVVLAMKSQDTAGALDALRRVADASVPIVCAQNGVENERAAARLFRSVYGVHVFLHASHLSPGVVDLHRSIPAGILDIGLYPRGIDDRAQHISADFSGAHFESHSLPDIMRWKYAKLLLNLGNVIEAACGANRFASDIAARARAEAVACYERGEIEWASDEEFAQRREALPHPQLIGGVERIGGSSWQSVARGRDTIETDYLNGEIVLLGRLHGVETPVNEALQRVGAQLVARALPPGSFSVAELDAEVGRRTPSSELHAAKRRIHQHSQSR